MEAKNDVNNKKQLLKAKLNRLLKQAEGTRKEFIDQPFAYPASFMISEGRKLNIEINKTIGNYILV